MQAVRAERAVQTMTQIMPHAGLLAVVAAVRRRVVVVLVAQGGHGALIDWRERRKCPFHGNGRVYVVSEAAALRQFLCFLPVLGRRQGSLHAVQRHRRVNRDRKTTCLGPFSAFQRFRHDRRGSDDSAWPSHVALRCEI